METFISFISPIITSALAWFIIDKFQTIKDGQDSTNKKVDETYSDIDKRIDETEKNLKSEINQVKRYLDDHMKESIKMHYANTSELNSLRKDIEIQSAKSLDTAEFDRKIEEVKAGMGILKQVMEALNSRTSEFGKIRLLEDRMDKVEGKIIPLIRKSGGQQ